ncbi:hypothetical protein GGF43_004754, partial [Coemansia sp. RSA 2618]
MSVLQRSVGWGTVNRCLQQRSFTRCLPRQQPRVRPRASVHPLGSSSRFGEYTRLVPPSLRASKPMPKEPSYDSVPAHITRPPYAKTGSPPSWDTAIPLLSPEEVDAMRKASVIARDALALGGSMVRPGVTTAHIDDEIHRFIVSQSAYPSCLNYMGFPKSVCTSVNNVIAHGIPDARQL